MKRFYTLIAALLAVVPMTFVSLSAPVMAASTPQQEICNGIGLTGTGNCGDSGAMVSNVLTIVINLLTSIIGAVAVIMIIVAGLRFITSGGDSSKVASAKNTLVYAIIGIIVVALAQLIVHFVIRLV